MIRVFIGYDPIESGAYHVLSNSIQRHSSMPVSITPVSLKNLAGILDRPRHPLQSNEFSFSRFLVPWMCNYEGWAIFMDCDMLLRDDIAKLWAHRDEKYAVKCVHHSHIPVETEKYLGTVQTKYQRKNWSSVILFNNARCRALTPEYVNNADGIELHQFRWLEDEEIGYLPSVWNHLVGYQPYRDDVKNVHWTIGGPYFREYANADFHQDWWKEKTLTEFIAQKNEPE